MRHEDRGVRDRRRMCRSLLGKVAVSVFLAASASACLTATSPRTAPPASKALRLPGFRVSPPPGRGWKGEADRPFRTASFSKKYGGFFRAMVDEQHRAEIFIKPLVVPPALWAAGGEELVSALKTGYAGSAGHGPASRWMSRPIGERLVEYATREDFIDATEEDTGLDTFTEEPRFKENELYGLFFPPDLETAHRYFEIYIRITEIDGILKLHEDERLPLLDAVVKGLEITGPFEDLPGPTGALARAVVAGDGEAMIKAVEEGADFNAELPDWSLFEVAAHCDRHDIAGLLDRDGGLAAVFADAKVLTPVLLALVADQPDLAALLIDKGARTGADPAGGPPLLAMAAGLGYPGLVTKLVESGADVDVRAVGGRTPLMFACESGSLECGQILIEAGASLDLQAEDGGTAVMTAVDWGRSEIMRLLLENGADINMQDNEGWSCLLVATFQGDAGLVGELIAAGADVDANVFATGLTPLLQALQGDQFEIARTLLAAGANANLHKDGQVTPLMVAVAKGRSDLVLLLIEKRADVNARSDDQKTALTIAESGGLTAIAEMLIKAGAKK
jgi:ankyrin repeat protein